MCYVQFICLETEGIECSSRFLFPTTFSSSKLYAIFIINSTWTYHVIFLRNRCRSNVYNVWACTVNISAAAIFMFQVHQNAIIDSTADTVEPKTDFTARHALSAVFHVLCIFLPCTKAFWLLFQLYVDVICRSFNVYHEMVSLPSHLYRIGRHANTPATLPTHPPQ